jgi:hypothetical protein
LLADARQREERERRRNRWELVELGLQGYGRWLKYRGGRADSRPIRSSVDVASSDARPYKGRRRQEEKVDPRWASV